MNASSVANNLLIENQHNNKVNSTFGGNRLAIECGNCSFEPGECLAQDVRMHSCRSFAVSY